MSDTWSSYKGLQVPDSPTGDAGIALKDDLVALADRDLAKPAVKIVSQTNVASLSGPQTVEGVALTAGDRVLLTAQTTATNNGPWVVQAAAWTRPVDAPTGSALAGALYFAENAPSSGNYPAQSAWRCTSAPGSDVVGTNSLQFAQVTGELQHANPIGTVVHFAGTTVPPYWRECNGAAVSRTTFAALFSAIGTTYGAGNGSTTFNLPNMARRVIVGRGGTGTATLGNAVGNVGGEENHTLTVNEMPSHAHNLNVVSVNTGTVTGGALDPAPSWVDNRIPYGAYHTGGSQSHNNLPPSLVLMTLINVGTP